MQEKIHEQVLAGGEERILFVEHPPVITFGRRAEVMGQKNLIASSEALAKMGVEVVQSDRGGDVTFHGPGQLVVYPIIRLTDHKLSVGGYVRLLQEAVDRVAAASWVSKRIVMNRPLACGWAMGDRADKILRWAYESARGYRCTGWR